MWSLVPTRLGWILALAVAIAGMLPVGRSLAAELVQNGEFDQNTLEWGFNSNLVEFAWDPLDVDNAATSGSVRVTSTETRLNVAVGITQCLVLPPGELFDFSGAVYVPSAQSETATVGYTLDWRAGDCGSRIELGLVGNAMETDAWELLESTVTPPDGAGSVSIVARITFAAKNDPDGAFTAHFDAVRLPEPSAWMGWLTVPTALFVLVQCRCHLG
jgi:hypothetical protein